MADQSVQASRAIISDIVLWIALAAILAAGIWWFGFRLPERRSQIITLQFRDANEITKGSAMRLMGMDIGYVSDLRFRGDHIDVVVRTNPGTPRIPSGAIFTVLFTGLAGGKSIEIELPETPTPALGGQPVYLVEEPIRMKDTLHYNIDMTQALQAGAENIADFFGRKKPIEELQFNIYQANQWSRSTLDFTGQLRDGLKQMEHQLDDGMRGTLDTLDNLNARARFAAEKTHPARIHNQVDGVIRGMKNFNEVVRVQTSGGIHASRLAGQLVNLNALNGKIGTWTKNTRNAVSGYPLLQRLTGMEHGLDNFQAFLDHFDALLENVTPASLQKTRRSIQGFNRTLIRWNQTIDAKAQPGIGLDHPGRNLSTHPFQEYPEGQFHERLNDPLRSKIGHPHPIPGQPGSSQSANQLESAAPPSGLSQFFSGIGNFCYLAFDALGSLFSK